jgi:hypothetical protein
MKIITRIIRTETGHYLYNGQLFECFIDARREMTREKPRLLMTWEHQVSTSAYHEQRKAPRR